MANNGISARIPSGVVDQYVYFDAFDVDDYVTRLTGLSSWTVRRSRNGAASAAMTTPTINETDSSNMPGVYELLLDEDMTIDSGDDSQAMVFYITHAGMVPVSLQIEIYRPKITAGETLTSTSGVATANTTQLAGQTVTAAAGVTFPTSVASPTNITAGTITTVTNLTNAPTNGDLTATMKTSVQTAANAAAVALGLDHLVFTSVTGTDIADDSIIAKLVSSSATSDWDSFVNTTDSLQAIRDNLAASAAIVSGTADSGSTTTMVDSARTESDNDYWNGCWIKFTSGTCSGQVRLITDFVASTDTITFAPATTQAVSTNTYEILPAAAVPWNAEWNTQVNGEVLDVLNVDTFAEIGTESPAATQTIRKMIAYLYKAWRNLSTQTSTTYVLKNDDGTTTGQSATCSDDGTTFTRGEVS